MRYAIGVDLGGTKIEAALVDEEGNKLEVSRFPTEVEKGPEAVAANIEKAVKQVKTKEIEGIGLGAPGFIRRDTSASNPNVPRIAEAWKIFHQKNPQSIIENDANCFALAEHLWGAGAKCKNMIGVIWGTGIGSGLIINGNLFIGEVGGAGEFGQMIMDHNIEKYVGGGPGTWENLCSGKHIIRRYLEAGGDPKNNTVPNIWSSKDEVSEKIKKQTIKWMGIALANLVKGLNPSLIVLGGGVSNLDIYEDLNEETRKYFNPLYSDSFEIVKNKLGDSAGVLGAAALVFRK